MILNKNGFSDLQTLLIFFLSFLQSPNFSFNFQLPFKKTIGERPENIIYEQLYEMILNMSGFSDLQ